MKNKVIVTIVVLVIGFLVYRKANTSEYVYKTQKLTVNNHTFTVEIADTPLLRNKGLSDRSYLAKDRGMLFVFPAVDNYSFWMKDMYFPLDFLWIRDNKVVDINENVEPPADPKRDPLNSFASDEQVKMVLEINAGLIKEYGIKKGDDIVIQ